MSKNNRYYNLVSNGDVADINIYGDITSLPWFDSDTSSHSLKSDIEALGDISQINVYINSYGGEVAEALAIYNTLKNHPARIVTVCDGFACSAASVIFMAGDERLMNEASLLLIHNAWTRATGNAEEMRKAADDLDIITNQSKTIYKTCINISDDELDAMMDKEKWIQPGEAVDWGFATGIKGSADDPANGPSQSVRDRVISIVANNSEEYTLIAKLKALIENHEPMNRVSDGDSGSDDNSEPKPKDITESANNSWSHFFN